MPIYITFYLEKNRYSYRLLRLVLLSNKKLDYRIACLQKNSNIVTIIKADFLFLRTITEGNYFQRNRIEIPIMLSVFLFK